MRQNFGISVKDLWISGKPYVWPNCADIGLICFYSASVTARHLHKLFKYFWTASNLHKGGF